MEKIIIWPKTQPTKCEVIEEFTDKDGTFYIVKLPQGDKLCIDKKHTEKVMEDRENDIQKICQAIINTYVRSTGDNGSGAECPFCEHECRWDADYIKNIQHHPDCIYLIAKDLSTNIN